MKRRDFEVRNQRGLKLVCSQWRPAFTEDTSKLPCVVYLHGNSSARVDVVKTSSLRVLGTAACTVVSFDFSGSGMSEGDFVTLGYFEQHDVADVLAYLRSNGMASRYLLWGRSMGAASALLYAARYPNHDLCGLILDSPFCSFKRLARDLVTEGQARRLFFFPFHHENAVNVPGFLVNGALGMLRHSVKKRTRCDLKTVAPIARARHIRCPCLFIAARKDVMVRPSHGADLSEAVGGASLFITCKGSHNSARPGIVLQAIGTFVKGCFQAPGTPISQAFSTIQNALQEAQATAAALRAGRGSTSSASSSVTTTTGGGGGGGRGRGSTTSARQRARATSVSSDLDVGASDPGPHVISTGDGGGRGRGRGRDSGAGSRPGPARPLARPGPRRDAEMERARRITSAAASARKSLSHSESPVPDRKSRKASRHDAYNRRRSKSHDEDVVDHQDCGGGSTSNNPDGRRRRGGDGDGSYVLEVGESPSFDLAADGEMGPDGEVRAVTVERRPGGGGGGSTGTSASSGSRGILPTRLLECPYPPRRPGQRQTAAGGGGDLDGGGGGTGELSPYPSPPPSASSSSRVAISATTLEQGGWRKTAHANPTAAWTTARTSGALGQRKAGAVALLFPAPRPPPPPPSRRQPTAGGSGVSAGKVPAPAETAAPAGVTAPVDDASSEGGAQGRPRQSYNNGRDNCSGEGGGEGGGGGGGAAAAAAPPLPRPRQNVRRSSKSSRRGRGSGWLGLGQVRLAAPALSSVFRSSNRSSAGRRFHSSGPVRGFPLDRSSDGSSGGVKRSPGAQRKQRGACTCGNDPAVCLCYVGGDMHSSEMMRRGGGQDKTMQAPPLHMRTASGKLKM
ncbi:unnamed protein product [Ectocarpus sp. 8 AP-2014]